MPSPIDIELLKQQKAQNQGFNWKVDNSLQKRLELIKQGEAMATGGPMQFAPGADPNYKPPPASEMMPRLGSMALDFVPVVGDIKSAQEAITGKDIITGDKLAGWERALAGAGVLPLIPNLATLKNISKETKGGIEMAKKTIDKFEVIGPQTRYSGGGYVATNIERFRKVIPDLKPTITENVHILYNDKKRGFSIWEDGKIMGAVRDLPDIETGISKSAANLIYIARGSDSPIKKELANIADAKQIGSINFPSSGIYNPGKIEKWEVVLKDGSTKDYFVASKGYMEGYRYEFFDSPSGAAKALDLDIDNDNVKSLISKLNENRLPSPQNNNLEIPKEIKKKEPE